MQCKLDKFHFKFSGCQQLQFVKHPQPFVHCLYISSFLFVLCLHLPLPCLHGRYVELQSTSLQRWFFVRAMESQWIGGPWASSFMSSWWAVFLSLETLQRSCSDRSSQVRNGVKLKLLLRNISAKKNIVKISAVWIWVARQLCRDVSPARHRGLSWWTVCWVYKGRTAAGRKKVDWPCDLHQWCLVVKWSYSWWTVFPRCGTFWCKDADHVIIIFPQTENCTELFLGVY